MKAVTKLSTEDYLKQELAKLKADYQNLFDESPLAMLVADINTSTIIGVNKAAINKYGYTKEQFLHLTLVDLHENCSSSDKPRQCSSYSSHYNKCGEILFVEVKESPIVYNGVSAQLFTISDATARVLAQEEEQKSKQRLDAIFRGTQDANEITGVDCHCDDVTAGVQGQLLIEGQNIKLKSNKEELQKLTNKLEKVMNSSLDIICSFDLNGRFVQVNEASSYVLGYTPGELVGRLAMDLVHPASVQTTLKAGFELVQGKDLISFQNVYIHKNGKNVYLSWSARFDVDEGLVYSVARDESSLQEAEKIKLVAEQRFTALVQKGADMVGIIDAEANYKFVSPNTETLLGYKPESLIQKNALTFIHPDDVHMAYSELEKVIKGGEIKLAAFRFKDAKGEWRWIETIATNELANPAINGIVVNSRDITERKKIETERELMIKELLKSNSDLKQFSFITSHNLRAPLSNIIGILNIIEYSALDDYNRQMIEMLDISAKQLQKTIDDLSRILVIKNNVNIEILTIDLQEAIDEVKGIFINTLNDVCAEIFTDFKVKEIRFNKTYLHSILINLLSNSIRYQSPNRSLIIKATSEIGDNRNVIFKFSDNGSGIDLSIHKNKVFGLYQRFHDKIEGQGLGLFIIKSQILALGGKIDVESEPGNGTTFTITFRNHTVGEEEHKEPKLEVSRMQTSLFTTS